MILRRSDRMRVMVMPGWDWSDDYSGHCVFFSPPPPFLASDASDDDLMMNARLFCIGIRVSFGGLNACLLYAPGLLDCWIAWGWLLIEMENPPVYCAIGM